MKSEKVEKKVRKSGKADFVLVVIILCLLMFGLVMLFSASSPSALQSGNVYSIIVKQSSISLIGCIGMIIAANYDYHRFRKLSKALIIVCLALMVLVPVIGFVSHGATRQISLGPISFQPSELSKFALIIYFASRFSEPKTESLANNRKNIIQSFIIVGMFVATCFMQSHLSAAMVIGLICLAMFIVAGLPMRIFWTFGGIGIAGMLGYGLTASYRLDRFRALFNPFAYERGIGWQIIQSLYAVGSGGLFGLGLGQSRQKYRYLPEAHNDYIYAVICEELGFVGGIVVMLLFVALVWRGMSIALSAKDRLGMLMAFGITAVIGLQMLINIGVVLSVLPSTGMQLPFFSAGGTSMIVMLTGMGILLNISKSSRIKKL